MASQASNASEAVSSQSTTRVALVTGANKGIGKEILLGLVNSGDYCESVGASSCSGACHEEQTRGDDTTRVDLQLLFS